MAAVDTWGRAAEAADVIFSPLLNLGDAGDTGVVRDGQLVSFQGFAAIAYGARGLSWYCWVHGALEPTKDIHWPTYDAVRTVNSHARAWAPACSRTVGLAARGSRRPAAAAATAGRRPRHVATTSSTTIE